MTDPRPRLSTNLAYVALVVTDVEAAATLLSRALGLSRVDTQAGDGTGPRPVFPVGASALALFAPDDPVVGGQARPGVHHLGLEVTRLEDAVRQATAVGLAPDTTVPSAGPLGAQRVLLPRAATAGVRLCLTEPLRLGHPDAAGVERIDHIGVASADNRAALDVFVERLGCPLESTQTDLEVHIAVESFTSDRYGVVYHTRPPQPVGGLRIAFVTVGDCELEFLQDFDPNQGAIVSRDRPGTTKQDQGAIARFVASRGPGLHHLALKVPDIDATLARLAAAGHAVIDRVGRPGSRRGRIGFLHPKALHGVLLHLVQRDAPGAPSCDSPSEGGLTVHDRRR